MQSIITLICFIKPIEKSRQMKNWKKGKKKEECSKKHRTSLSFVLFYTKIVLIIIITVVTVVAINFLLETSGEVSAQETRRKGKKNEDFIL